MFVAYAEKPPAAQSQETLGILKMDGGDGYDRLNRMLAMGAYWVFMWVALWDYET